MLNNKFQPIEAIFIPSCDQTKVEQTEKNILV